MPKVTKHPRLRSYVRKNKDGRVRVYYFYDMRPEKDIPLGTDYAEALAKWDELHNHKPRIAGRIQEAIERWKERELHAYQDETRKGYSKQIDRITAVFGLMTWDEITLPILREYLDRRTAKVQGNRELSVFSIVWSKARLWGMTEKQWPAYGVKNWKNAEEARSFTVTDALFDAVYSVAGQMLRDCMDIATATGMRLTDCRTVLMPSGDTLRLKASKTGKSADFALSLSNVLPDLVTRRRSYPASHLMLLSTPDGFAVTAGMLRSAWDTARADAIRKPENRLIAADLRKMYLRDMRKRASDLADDSESASKLLQHSSVGLTEKHYRGKVSQLKPVR